NLNWQRALYPPLAAQVNPTATIEDAIYSVVELSYGAQQGHGHVALTLAEVTLAQITAPNFTDYESCTATISYGRLNPAFPLAGSTYGQYGNNYPLVGGQMARIPAFIYSADLLPAFTSTAQGPRVTPATNLTLDGMSASGALSLSTLTPTVAWTAPANARSYDVVVYRLLAAPDANGNTFAAAARIFTSATSVTLPQGVMAAGTRYVIRVRTLSEPTGDAVNAPFRRGSWPFGFADALTGTIIQP
ncbi:MAG: hypothetical protein JNK82_03375, partial [Myxococcaceae bacterium]|nr:hypothetical protein [Myxococcaceae bacterium]